MQRIAADQAAIDRCVVLGRGYHYATAREWSLKLKEMAYVLADPYSAADFIHGPLALIEAGFPILAVAPRGATTGDMEAVIERLGEGLRARLLIASDDTGVVCARHLVVAAACGAARVAHAYRLDRALPAPRHASDACQGPRRRAAALDRQGDPDELRPVTRPSSQPEVALYPPVKTLFESLGYDVKGEVIGCDVVATRGDEAPVIVELKRTFGLGLVLQGVERLALSDAVYLGVGAWPPRLAPVRKLCQRVGLGLIVVVRDRATIVVEPVPYRPRKSSVRLARLLDEHRRRAGDPTPGGSVRRPIMTAYRQEALRCAARLRAGPSTVRAIRIDADAPRAGRILLDDVYGWFERVARGTYALSPRGRQALENDGVVGSPILADDG